MQKSLRDEDHRREGARVPPAPRWTLVESSVSLARAAGAAAGSRNRQRLERRWRGVVAATADCARARLSGTLLRAGIARVGSLAPDADLFAARIGGRRSAGTLGSCSGGEGDRY